MVKLLICNIKIDVSTLNYFEVVVVVVVFLLSAFRIASCVRTADTVMCHSGLAQPCYLLKGRHCFGLMPGLELRAMSVEFLFPMKYFTTLIT